MLILRLFVIGLFLLIFNSPALAQTSPNNTTTYSLPEPTIGVQSQLLFLKRIMENVKLRITSRQGEKDIAQINFTKERVKETYSLILHEREDLIEPIMEEYRRIITKMIYRRDLSSDEVIHYSGDLVLLEKLFNLAHSQGAKRSIRASIDFIQERLWAAIENTKAEKEREKILSDIKQQLTSVCEFFDRDSKSDVFNEVERAISQEKFIKCSKRISP